MATRVEIRVEGRLSPALAHAFAPLEVRAGAGETVLAGELPDREALHQMLERIDTLGLELIEARSW